MNDTRASHDFTICSICRSNTAGIATSDPYCFKGYPVDCSTRASAPAEIFRSIRVAQRSLEIDLSPAMLARAERRKNPSAASIELKKMDVTALDFPDRSFDAAVATFLFCVLPDELQLVALRELGRVVKPGGVIRMLEYVRPQGAIRRAIAKLSEPWIAWAYGASFDRRTEAYVPTAGPQLLESRFVVDDLIKLISIRTRNQ